MDKQFLSYYLLNEIEQDVFLQKKYSELLLAYAGSLFGNNSAIYDDEYKVLLRYADMLSLSREEKHQNLAQQIVILLSKLFPNETEIAIFKQNIYLNVSNFIASNVECTNDDIYKGEILREVEVEAHKIGNSITGTSNQLFDAQRIAFLGIENNQFYSFSAPTSMGKTFVITNYIHKQLRNGSTDNYVIVVPTRALLSEIANKMILEFSDVLGVGKHKIITTVSSVQNNENFVAVLTPERLYYALLKQPDIVFDYVFIDEAHKISDKDKRSIIYYKILDMLLNCKDTHIYFSSPIIPNPDIYLELTNYYTLENNQAKGQAFAFSPVIQNKISIDFLNRKYSIINNLAQKNMECGTLPVEITDKLMTLINIGKRKRNLIYVSSANKAINYAMQLSDMITRDEYSNDQEELEMVAKLIEQKIHKDYYLAKLIRKGVAYHIGALPADIRAKIEHLVRNRNIDYCFCTSTLLEGVNVPVDNLFIFDNKKANAKMSEVDAFNLMGRAGRVTLNECGNVFLFVGDNKTKQYYEDILLKPLPSQSLLPSKVLKKSHKKYIVSVLLEGRTNLLLLGEKYEDRGFTEVTYEYATKCLNMLLHDICCQNDSYVVRDFRKDKALSPQNIIDIKNKFGSIINADDDINLSALQKESLLKAVRNNSINYPSTFNYDECLSFLERLSSILQWNIYEKDTLGKGEKIKYYTVILTQWMQSSGLHEIIRSSISYYQTHGGSLISFDPVYHIEPYNDSLKHRNQVINEVMKDLEQVINYRLSMYFLRLSEAIISIYGKNTLKNDWYEYVEYGTCNEEVILLQKYGFLREDALLLLKSPYVNFIKFDNHIIHIKKDILAVAKMDLHESIKAVSINFPEIFVD